MGVRSWEFGVRLNTKTLEKQLLGIQIIFGISENQDNLEQKREGKLRKLSLDESKWLWEYRLHQEKILYSRLNFFLVAVSMFFVAFVTVIDHLWLAVVIGVFGLVISVCSWMAIKRQHFVVKFAMDQLYSQSSLSVYKELKDKRTEEEKKSWIGYIPGQEIFFGVIPLAVILAWIALLLLLFLIHS